MKDVLTTRIKQGDEKAFELFFYKYFISLCCFINKYFNKPLEAKEIAQEAFTKIWELRNDIDPTKNLKGYLFKAAQNICLNKLRRLKVESKYEEIYKLVYTNHYELSVEESFLAKELDGIVINAINMLPAKCRRIFKMSRFERLKNKEIAEIMNISIKTVEAQMTKALRIIRLQLTSNFTPNMSSD